MFRKILALKLRLITKLVLRKYHPKVIAITGSYGKSSTKEAVFHVLSSRYTARKNEANYNTEIGVPLAVLGEVTPGRDILGWFGVFVRGLGLIFAKRDFPQYLVLEMGADRIGELARLTSFIKPDISIITAVGISHLEYFGNRETVRYEKGSLIRALSHDGVAVLNADNDGAISFKKDFSGKVLTYGLNNELADLRAENVKFENNAGKFAGTSFDLVVGNQRAPVLLEESLGQPMVYAFLAAAAVGLECGMVLDEIVKSGRTFVGLPGRLKIIDGINGSVLIDDSYNATPDSMRAALKVLSDLPGGRKIAVLGKMAELGSETEAGHKEVGMEVAGQNIDLLFVKNNQAGMIADEALKRGFDVERIVSFEDSAEAVNELKKVIQKGDVVLLKASQSDYFEDIITEIMAYPEQADLLVQRDYTRS